RSASNRGATSKRASSARRTSSDSRASDRKSTRLNSSHLGISYAVFCLKQISWRGVWIVIGIGALIVWLFRFALPESPRYLSIFFLIKGAPPELSLLPIPGPFED